MRNLMLHCGANALTREELAVLPVPEARGPRHVTRPFIDDVDIVRNEVIKGLGMQIAEEAYGVLFDKDKTPTKFFGLLQIANGVDNYALTIGLRGAYDQSLKRGLAVGSRVFVCDNLAFSGEIVIATKQTTFIHERIATMFHQAVGRIPAMAEKQNKRFDDYRNTVISKERGDAALIELVRRNALNPSQIGRAIKEWDEPSYEEHTEGGRTIWRLHNAVTQAIKPSNEERATVPVAWQRTRPLVGILDQLAEAA